MVVCAEDLKFHGVEQSRLTHLEALRAAPSPPSRPTQRPIRRTLSLHPPVRIRALPRPKRRASADDARWVCPIPRLERSPLRYSPCFTVLCGTICPGSQLHLLRHQKRILSTIVDFALQDWRKQARAIDLLGAARNGRVDDIRAKLHLTSIDIHSERGPLSHNAVHEAARKGHTKALRVLLECGGEPNRGGMRNHSATAFQLAAANGHCEALRLMLQCSGDLNKANNNGNTAVHEAAINGQTKALQLLLQNGGDPNIAGNNGFTAVHWAATNGHTEALHLLIRSGGDPHKADKYGCTAVTLAAFSGHPLVLEEAPLSPSLLHQIPARSPSTGYNVLPPSPSVGFGANLPIPGSTLGTLDRDLSAYILPKTSFALLQQDFQSAVDLPSGNISRKSVQALLSKHLLRECSEQEAHAVFSFFEANEVSFEQWVQWLRIEHSVAIPRHALSPSPLDMGAAANKGLCNRQAIQI